MGSAGFPCSGEAAALMDSSLHQELPWGWQHQHMEPTVCPEGPQGHWDGSSTAGRAGNLQQKQLG